LKKLKINYFKTKEEREMIEYRDFDKNYSLENKNAIITGGANGIGYAIALLYAEKGANVFLFDIAKNGEEQAQKLSSQFSIIAKFVKTDVSKKEAIQASVDEVLTVVDKIDILVNNAGVVFLDSAENLSEEGWNKTILINQTAVFLVSQVVGNVMIKQGFGKIVNMASQAGVIALEKHLAYSASKGAVIAMTKVLAYEWAKYGINVNAISPTIVLTDLGKKAWAGKVGEDMKKIIPNERFCEPNEVAALAVFLASDASMMINGTNIMIDGAYSIK
jgi:NAD(P)-dependent dehydrogenase (short-subunit alcohol dehydrogenase family)